MRFTKKELCKKLNISMSCLLIYMSRSEFSHIQCHRQNKKIGMPFYYDNFTKEDLTHLKNLVRRKKGFNYLDKHKEE